MKKLPLSIIPISIFVLFMLSFLFLPKNSDLTSPMGDYYIGQALSCLFLTFLFIDIIRLIRNRRKK